MVTIAWGSFIQIEFRYPFFFTIKGRFNTPLEHTRSNLYQKAKEGFLSYPKDPDPSLE